MTQPSKRLNTRHLNRSRYAVWVLLTLLISCRGEDPPAPEPKAAPVTPTHIVLITLDTTRADALGVYGQAMPTTPNIDRMSGEGLRFAHAMTSAPSTLPSHATILTGKMPYAHGVRSNSGYVLADANQTLAEVLARHGFATAAEIAAPVIGRQTKLNQGFATYRDTASTGIQKKTIALVKKDAVSVDASDVLYLDERAAAGITDRGIEFVRAHRTEKSFLWLHYFDPHIFYAPPSEFRARFENPYFAEVSYVDAEIGRFLDTLRGLGLDDETLVVLTADHGEGLREHDETNHSYFVYDTTMRVPLVMWGSTMIRRGSLVNSLVRTADIAPTVLDLLELPPLEGIQGVSLVPLIAGESKDLGLTAYGESIETLAFGSSMIRFVREGPWKYIHKVNPELYDVVTDPGELSNLASSRPEIVERLRARMADVVSEGSAAPSGEVPLDAERRAQLQALGYVAVTPSAAQRDSLSGMELVGTDPLELVSDIRLMGRALGARRQHRYEKAAERFGTLWQKFGSASFGLFRAEMLSELGRFDEVIEQLDALDSFSEDPGYIVAFGNALSKVGRTAEAREQFLAALAIDRCDLNARIHLAHLYFVEGSYPMQHEVLRVGAGECSGSEELQNNYAYALATCPDAAQRDGKEALRLALAVNKVDGSDHSGHLDTLAAAHAEVGDLETATRTSKKSVQFASHRQSDDPGEGAHLDELKRHLAVFESGKPLRDPSD